MTKWAVILASILCVSSSYAACPTIGALCDGVVEPAAEDFWIKWNAADAVVLGTVLLSPDCCPSGYICAIGSYDGPQPGACSMLVAVTEVWKGPGPLSGISVATRWMYDYPTGFGAPIPGYAEWGQESCTLTVTQFSPTVFFLDDVDGQWETYECMGTGIYSREWLVSEVGAPVATEPLTWGSLKACYR